MADKNPEIKLNPEAMPWGRSVEKRLGNTEVKTRQVATESASTASAVTTVQQDVAAAQTAVNNKVTFSTDAASGTGYNENDTWFQRNVNGEIIAQWSFVGGKWESRTLSNSVIANLDAGKITAGILNAALVTISTNGLTGQRVTLDGTGLKGYDSTGTLKTSVGTDGSLAAVDATMTGVYKTAVSGRRIEISPTTTTAAGYLISNQSSVKFVYRDTVTAPLDPIGSYPPGTVTFKQYDSGLTSFIDEAGKNAQNSFNGPRFSQGVTSPGGAGAGTSVVSGSLNFYQQWVGDGSTAQNYTDGENVAELQSSDILFTSTDSAVGTFNVGYASGPRGISFGSSSAITFGRSRLSSASPIINIGDSDTDKPLTLNGSTVGIKGATTVTGALTVTGATTLAAVTATTLSATTSVAAPRHLVGTRQYATPEVANATARNTLFSSPVAGDRCYRVDMGWEEAYYTSVSGIVATSGWYPMSGAIPLFFGRASNNVPTGSTYTQLTTYSTNTARGFTFSGGNFTAQYSGYYQFSITGSIQGTGTHEGILALFVNGAEVATNSDTATSIHWSSPTLSALLKVTAGDVVNVRARQASGSTLVGGAVISGAYISPA